MHAHDRTMLANLGFADPDKRNPLHDLACQYLALPGTADKIVGLLGLEHGPEAYREEFDCCLEEGAETRRVRVSHVAFEHPIVKGSGQYRTSIGFADLVLGLDVETERTGVTERRKDYRGVWGRPEKKRDLRSTWRRLVGMEVKIAPVPIGDVIRQVKLYGSYTDRQSCQEIHRWVVTTAYPISSLDVQCLRNERITHVVLGEGFKQFVADQDAPSDQGNVEV